jgi:pimeloyl-ACP methyl ester carboxylesterase
MPFANSNGLKLHYEMEGKGPPLLLIAGTGYGGATWYSGVAESFVREGFTVITYDHRGLGKSDKPDGLYSTRQFAADAAGLLKELDIDDVHALGHSMGGRVAQWLALDHPDCLRSLVLAASGPGEFDPNFKVTRGIPLQAGEGLILKGYEGYIREHIAGPFFFTHEFTQRNKEIVANLVDAFWDNRGPLHHYLKHIIARQRHQTAERLQEIRCPTLVIVGDDDHVSGGTGNHLRQSQFLSENIPNGKLKIIDDAAHAFFWEKPEEAIQAVVNFLWEHDAVRIDP